MRPTFFVSISVCMMLAASQLHASTETYYVPENKRAPECYLFDFINMGH